MSGIPLDNKETQVIFTQEAWSNFGQLDGTIQQDILERLETMASASVPPDNLVYEQIANIDIIRPSDGVRLYSKVIANIPRGNTMYHVIYVLYIDEHHDYDRSDLATFSPLAEAKLDSLTSIRTVPELEGYFQDHDALSLEDIRDLLD